VIQLHQHLGGKHAFNVVIGGYDDVIAGVATTKLGKKLIVVGEQIVLYFYA